MLLMLPLTRHGWREMLIGTLLLSLIAWGLWHLYPLLALLPLIPWIWLLAFFRDPPRRLPADPLAIVSPADGKVSDITQLDHFEPLAGPCLRVGIFLSVFNVHINRSPCDGRATAVVYTPGKFINALHSAAASQQNESNLLVLAEPGSHRPVAAVKQIVGLIARRIVCTAKPGDALARGQRIGMIKFGSRTELYLPLWLDPHLRVQIGQKVRAGCDAIAVTARQPTEANSGTM
jgi:phosphatidylserine decarboxylase